MKDSLHAYWNLVVGESDGPRIRDLAGLTLSYESLPNVSNNCVACCREVSTLVRERITSSAYKLILWLDRAMATPDILG